MTKRRDYVPGFFAGQLDDLIDEAVAHGCAVGPERGTDDFEEAGWVKDTLAKLLFDKLGVEDGLDIVCVVSMVFDLLLEYVRVQIEG